MAYLDKNGLSYFYAKLKATFAKKYEDYNNPSTAEHWTGKYKGGKQVFGKLVYGTITSGISSSFSVGVEFDWCIVCWAQSMGRMLPYIEGIDINHPNFTNTYNGLICQAPYVTITHGTGIGGRQVELYVEYTKK